MALVPKKTPWVLFTPYNPSLLERILTRCSLKIKSFFVTKLDLSVKTRKTTPEPSLSHSSAVMILYKFMSILIVTLVSGLVNSLNVLSTETPSTTLTISKRLYAW